MLKNKPARINRTPKGSEILKYARQSRGYSQIESAVTYGIEERTLRRWENSEYTPRWDDVVSLVEDVYMLDITSLIINMKEGVK